MNIHIQQEFIGKIDTEGAKSDCDDFYKVTHKDLQSDSGSENESVELSHQKRIPGGSAGSSVSLAPRWIYGTTIPPPTSSVKSNSGMCMSEKGQLAIAQPEVIQNFLFPTTEKLKEKIYKYRERLARILCKDISSSPQTTFINPLLVITGPSYISDPIQAKACAQWVGTIIGKEFNNLPEKLLPENIRTLYAKRSVPQHLMLAIRANLTKYNYDFNDDSFVRGSASIMTYEIEQGIPICRALLCELAEICPIVGESSDTITPQYLCDLFCLGIIGSTLVESQLHRELASGTSYSIGFNTSDSVLPFDKAMYSHRVTSALDAMYTSSQPHQFLSVTKIGTVAVVGTVGNQDTFIILQVNLELNYEELSKVISDVYEYDKVKFRTPKVMLDVGRLSNRNYEAKMQMIRHILLGQHRYKIIGVIIDSGDHYIPKGHQIDLAEKSQGDFIDDVEIDENEESQKKLIELNRYFVKMRIYKSPSNRSESTAATISDLEAYYENFINADKMIQQLEQLSYQRIGDVAPVH